MLAYADAMISISAYVVGVQREYNGNGCKGAFLTNGI